MSMLQRVLLCAALTLSASAASAAAPTIVVERPEIRASLGASPTAAGYLIIRNTGAAPDRLVGVACACARSVMAHQTLTGPNGVARMAHEPAVTIPARGQVVFAPGGRHLMLMGLKAPIRAGTKTSMVLRFEKAGEVSVTFTATATPGAGHAGH